MGTTTPNFNLYKPSVGETGWGALVNTNMDTIDANLTNALPRSYLAGAQLRNDGTSPNTKIDISPGQAQDAGNAGAITLGSILIKDLSAVWSVGSGNGGIASAVSPRQANTWYHVFLIKRTDTNVVDAYFDTSVTAVNIPSPYTLFRRLGSVKTDGSSNILAFAQDGDLFQWATNVLDVNLANPGIAAVLRALTVPPGVAVQVTVIWSIAGSTTNAPFLVTDPAITDQTPGFTLAQFSDTTAGTVAQSFWTITRTNTSKQVRTRLAGSDANTVLTGRTMSWLDPRGRNN
jgi:hypothetical protein